MAKLNESNVFIESENMTNTSSKTFKNSIFALGLHGNESVETWSETKIDSLFGLRCDLNANCNRTKNVLVEHGFTGRALYKLDNLHCAYNLIAVTFPGKEPVGLYLSPKVCSYPVEDWSIGNIVLFGDLDDNLQCHCIMSFGNTYHFVVFNIPNAKDKNAKIWLFDGDKEYEPHLTSHKNEESMREYLDNLLVKTNRSSKHNVKIRMCSHQLSLRYVLKQGKIAGTPMFSFPVPKFKSEPLLVIVMDNLLNSKIAMVVAKSTEFHSIITATKKIQESQQFKLKHKIQNTHENLKQLSDKSKRAISEGTFGVGNKNKDVDRDENESDTGPNRTIEDYEYDKDLVMELGIENKEKDFTRKTVDQKNNEHKRKHKNNSDGEPTEKRKDFKAVVPEHNYMYIDQVDFIVNSAVESKYIPATVAKAIKSWYEGNKMPISHCAPLEFRKMVVEETNYCLSEVTRCFDIVRNDILKQLNGIDLTPTNNWCSTNQNDSELGLETIATAPYQYVESSKNCSTLDDSNNGNNTNKVNNVQYCRICCRKKDVTLTFGVYSCTRCAVYILINKNDPPAKCCYSDGTSRMCRNMFNGDSTRCRYCFHLRCEEVGIKYSGDGPSEAVTRDTGQTLAPTTALAVPAMGYAYPPGVCVPSAVFRHNLAISAERSKIHKQPVPVGQPISTNRLQGLKVNTKPFEVKPVSVEIDNEASSDGRNVYKYSSTSNISTAPIAIEPINIVPDELEPTVIHENLQCHSDHLESFDQHNRHIQSSDLRYQDPQSTFIEDDSSPEPIVIEPQSHKLRSRRKSTLSKLTRKFLCDICGKECMYESRYITHFRDIHHTTVKINLGIDTETGKVKEKEYTYIPDHIGEAETSEMIQLQELS